MPPTIPRTTIRRGVCVECGTHYDVPRKPGGVQITCSTECQRLHRNKVVMACRNSHTITNGEKHHAHR